MTDINQSLEDLLWEFGIWDDLTHEQHIKLSKTVRKLVLAEITALENKGWLKPYHDAPQSLRKYYEEKAGIKGKDN